MTSPLLTAALRRAVSEAADRLRAQGWDVVVDPAPTELPRELVDARPDLLASRGDERVLVQVRSPRLPPRADLVQLAEQVERLPGWRLDFVYVPESPPTSDPALLAARAARADRLAGTDPEAGLMLAWAAAEGTLHRLAERLGRDTDDPGALVAGLVSLGVVHDEEYEVLHRARLTRDALAHGREGPSVDGDLVRRLNVLTRSFAGRAEAA